MSDPSAPATTIANPPALTPPDPVPVIQPDQAADRVKLTPQEQAQLDSQVAKFIDDVTGLDIHGKDFQARIDAINTLGDQEMAATAGMSNRMLARPVNAMNGGIFNAQSPVSKSLLDLRNTVENLDPSRQGDLFQPRKLLGLIPFGNRLREYFESYQSAQSHLNAIIQTLYRSKDELQKDDVAIEQEKQELWALMQRLEQYVYLGKKLDAALTAKIAQIEAADPARAKILKEEALFYVRQKVTDLLTQTAVDIQGYLALDLVRRNNVELIKGVDRATTTTVSALRTAVMVAQALANQKLVLDQITALNATTSAMIEHTSEVLKEQSGAIYQQASSSTVDMASLQKAFDNVYATMDMISDYKVKALDSMSQTVDALEQQVSKAKTYLDKTRSGVVSDAMSQLPPTADGGVVKLVQ